MNRKFIVFLLSLVAFLPTLSTSSESIPGQYDQYKYQGSSPQSIEDWDLARNRYASDVNWKKWVGAEQQRLQRWTLRGGDRAEWIAGYMHDYFHPVTFQALKWTEDTPAPPSGPLGSAEAKRFGGWVFYFRSRNVAYILLAARLFKLTGDHEALEWAKAQIDFYSRQYSRWPIQSRGSGQSRLMNGSLDEAQLMAGLVPAIRLIQADVPAEQLTRWKDELLAPVAANLIQSFYAYNNIAVWQRAMAANIALLLQDEVIWQEAVWGNRGIVAILRSATTKDGLWNEGTFGYSEYVVLALLPFLHEAQIYGRHLETESLRRAAYDLFLAPLALRFPDSTLPNPGDSTGFPSAFKPNLLRETAYLLPTRAGIVEWQATRNWSTLLVNWNPEPKFSGGMPLQSRRMDSSGFAMLRNMGWHVFLHFGQASPNHAQYEALSYEVHLDGGRITTDLGTTAYSSPLHQNYFTRAAAHNVPIVDDRGQKQFSLGSLVKFNPKYGSMAAVQHNYQPGTKVTRSFSAASDSLNDLIEVTREPKADGSIGTVVHLDCTVSLPVLPRAPLPVFPNESGFSYWKNLTGFRLSRNLEFPANCGKLQMRISIEGPRNGILVVGDPPTLDSRSRTAMFVRYPVSSGQIRTTYTLLGEVSHQSGDINSMLPTIFHRAAK